MKLHENTHTTRAARPCCRLASTNMFIESRRNAYACNSLKLCSVYFVSFLFFFRVASTYVFSCFLTCFHVFSMFFHVFPLFLYVFRMFSNSFHVFSCVFMCLSVVVMPARHVSTTVVLYSLVTSYTVHADVVIRKTVRRKQPKTLIWVWK